ncbi:MAG: hypothetical protein RLZZ602_1606 [Pseudomonadota bacterium]|jgi:hypothetical protein
MKKMKYQAGGEVEDWEALGFPSKEMYEEARDAETDRKMQEAMKRHEKTRVGGGKKDDKPEEKEGMAMGGKVGSSCGTKKKMAMGGMAKGYAKGGKVRGCGMAKKGVRKCKMY